MAHWIGQEGLSLDVCSSGEVTVASAAGFPGHRLILHGNAKSPADLDAAFHHGVGRIVIDSLPEIARIAALAPRRQRVLIRVTPGVDAHAHRAVARLRLPVPRLVIEPGRAIVNRAMATLYRVLAVKHAPGGRTFVAVDGGMSDNPRPELYGARYSVHAVLPSRTPSELVTVVGRHCEAGDILAADVPLPADLRPGDLVAVPGTGAYNHSMASNYNLIGRPPVIAVLDGAARPLIRRETSNDLLARDIGL